MSRIAITDYFTEPNIEELKVLGDLVGMGLGEDTEVLLVWHQKIDEAFCSKLPNLKGVQRYGVGYDTLDLQYLKSKGIVCCNNPDYGTEEVADTTIAMIMNSARGIYRYNENAKKITQGWQEHLEWNIRRTSDLTVGVIGAGRIGGSVILKCNGLRFKTVFYDPYKESGYEKMLNAKRVDNMEELLQMADIVTIHTPLNNETKGIVDSNFLSKMKKGSSFINSARGGLVADLDDLFQNLESGQLSDIALDVLTDEPPVNNKLIAAWRDVNNPLQGRIIINPHSSYYSQQSYYEIRFKAAQNALKIYNGEKASNLL